MWPDLIDWIKGWPMRMKLCPADLDSLTFCSNINEVLDILEPQLKIFNERVNK